MEDAIGRVLLPFALSSQGDKGEEDLPEWSSDEEMQCVQEERYIGGCVGRKVEVGDVFVKLVVRPTRICDDPNRTHKTG